MATDSNSSEYVNRPDSAFEKLLNRPATKMVIAIALVSFVPGIVANSIGFPEVAGLLFALGIIVMFLSFCLIYLPLKALKFFG